MDQLKIYYAHVSDYVRSMTPGSRAVAGLLSLVIVISLGYLCTSPLAESTESLLGSQPLSPEALGTMQLALDEAGLPGDVDGSRILIPRGRRSEYVAALKRAGALPCHRVDAMAEAIENDTLLSSQAQRKALYNRAKTKRLEAEIAEFAGVADATVQLDSVEQRNHGRRETLHTAVVGVNMKPGEKLDTKLGAMICQHVAGSVAGMHPDQVKVSDKINLRHYQGVGNGEGDAASPDYLANRVVLEEECKERVERLLKDFISDVQVVVRVQPASAHIARRSQGTVHQSNREDPTRFEQGETFGTPSAMIANRPCELPVASSRDAGRQEIGTLPDDGPIATTTPPFQVSIRVPNRYFQEVWSDRTVSSEDVAREPDRRLDREAVEAQTIGKIKQLAASVLPPVDGIADLSELVTVIRLPDCPVREKVEQAETRDGFAWRADYTSVLGTLVLAGAGYLMFRSVRGRLRPSSAAARTALAAPIRGSNHNNMRDPHESCFGIELDGQLARRLIAGRPMPTDDSEPALRGARDAQDIGNLFFEEVSGSDYATLQYVGETAGMDLLALALVGAPPEIIDRLLGSVSSKLAASTDRLLREWGPTRLSDVDAARRQLIELMSPTGNSSPDRQQPALSAAE